MTRFIQILACTIGFIALFALFCSGLAYQAGLLELGQAFALLRYSAIAGLVGAIIAVSYGVWQRPRGVKLAVVLLAAIGGLAAFYLPYQQQQRGRQAPPIHDLTTDTLNPPAFVAIAPLRAAAPNPASYDGEEVATAQRSAYPDLVPVAYTNPASEVFAAATALIQQRGWELVAAELTEGRIEATATTRWFGFKDDVVLRLTPTDANSTTLDMRSKSRIGRSDVGTNAARIRSFLDDLSKQLRADAAR
jgi:uncharacterized protein (DUF1499 family)